MFEKTLSRKFLLGMFFTTTKTEAKKSYDDLTQNSVSQENFFVAFSIISEDIFPI
jgi:hypothetical protein